MRAVVPNKLYFKVFGEELEARVYRVHELMKMVSDGYAAIIDEDDYREDKKNGEDKECTYIVYFSEDYHRDRVDMMQEEAVQEKRDELEEEAYEKCYNEVLKHNQSNDLIILHPPYSPRMVDGMKGGILQDLFTHLSEKELEEIREKYVKKG